MTTSESPATRLSGRLSLFGHEATPATVEAVRRSRRWRTVRALRTFAVGLLVAPVVALVPPHAPWAIGALAAGVILARRRLRERVTLLSARGACPRCGAPVEVEGPVALGDPHPVPCESCHHEAALRVDVAPAPEAPSPPAATPPSP